MEKRRKVKNNNQIEGGSEQALVSFGKEYNNIIFYISYRVIIVQVNNTF
jgi:hypothetical protein